MIFNVGDIIRDVEDGDCYFEGQVTEVVENEMLRKDLAKLSKKHFKK